MNVASIGAATGAKLTAADVERGRTYLEQARAGVVEATSGLSDAQWNFKPAPDRWSIAEALEHIVVVYELVLGPVRAQIANAPAPPEDFDCRLIDGLIVTRFPDRSMRFPAPEILHPAGRCSPSAALERLNESTKQLTGYLEATPDVREHLVDSPPLRALTTGQHHSMDGYGWILAAAAHTLRHTQQILEIKSDPRFPR